MKSNNFLIVFLVSISLINTSLSQDSIRDITVGYSLSFLSWNKFYNSDLNFNKNIFQGIAFYPMSDLIIKIPLMKRSELNLNLGNIQKKNETKAKIPYSLDYLTFSPGYGIDFFRKKDSQHSFVGLGPYFGYLLDAKKGDDPIVDDKLRQWDYGIQFLYTTYDDRNRNTWDLLNFFVYKFQLGFADVLYFRTMSFTMSMLGYIY